MEPNLAKCNKNLDIEEDSSTVRKTATQPNHRMNKKGTTKENSKTGREIEAIVLEKTAAKPVPLSRLVKELSHDRTCKPDKVISQIIRLQANKKILIREPAPYKTFQAYLLSPISMWFWEVALATIVSLSLIFASSGWALYFRYVFAGLMVLFLPGYSLVGLIYSRRNDLDYLTRIVLSLVLSLAIATLVGLVVNFTPFGITLFAVALSLGAVTIGLLLLTVLRRYAHYRLARAMTAE